MSRIAHAALFGALAVLAAAGAHAEEPASTGVGTCDAFLKAYEQCAASPGIPAVARPGITQGIAAMRNSFRDAAARSNQVRAALAQQCVQSHAMVRKSLTEAYKCDFPEPPTLAADAGVSTIAPAPTAAPAPSPAPSPAQLEAQPGVKANAYTKVHNSIVDNNPMRKQLADHLTNNERVLKLGTRLGANAWYLFGVSDFDHAIEALKEAIALPGSVPEVDPAATRLLAALQAVNPTIKALSKYQTTREFNEDGFKFARTQQPILVAGLRTAIGAEEEFSTALFDRRMAIDQQQLEAMPADSLARHVLATSLVTRRLVRRYEGLDTPADVAPFLATLADVVASNKVLAATLGGMSPKPDSACADYSGSIDTLIGHGRDMARDVRTGGNPSQPAQLFATAYNGSIRDLGNCRKNEARAQP